MGGLWTRSWEASDLALAAYDSQSTHRRWEYKNACGVLSFEDGVLLIGIAGTNDSIDLYQDVNVRPRNLYDWSFMADIPLCKDARDVVSTVGFLDYAAFCYIGITRAINEMGIDRAAIRGIVLSGHSLGAAAAQLLQMTPRFESAEAHLYGSPKVWKRGSRVPERLRTHAWQVTDLVTYAPISCKHATCQNLIVTGGVPHSRIPFSRIPVMALLAAFVWVTGGWKSLLTRFGVSVKNGLFTPHHMKTYRKLLER